MDKCSNFLGTTPCKILYRWISFIDAQYRIHKGPSSVMEFIVGTIMGEVSGLITPVLFICINSFWRRRNGRRYAENVCKCIFLNENFWISNIISLKYVPLGLIDTTLWLVQMTPNRRQAIIVTSDGLFYWRIYASRGLIELIVADGQSATISQDGTIFIKGEHWEILHFTVCINHCKILTYSRVYYYVHFPILNWIQHPFIINVFISKGKMSLSLSWRSGSIIVKRLKIRRLQMLSAKRWSICLGPNVLANKPFMYRNVYQRRFTFL